MVRGSEAGEVSVRWSQDTWAWVDGGAWGAGRAWPGTAEMQVETQM